MSQEVPLPLEGGSDVPKRQRFRNARSGPAADAFNNGIGEKTWECIRRLRKAGKRVERRGAQILVDEAIVTWDELHWMARHLKADETPKGGKQHVDTSIESPGPAPGGSPRRRPLKAGDFA